MKRYFVITIFICFAIACNAQAIEGRWYGILKVNDVELRLIFNVSRQDTTLVATMDSPDQGVKGIPMENATFVNAVFRVEQKTAMIEYSGIHLGNIISGTFKQRGQSFPLNLSRRPFERPGRPQEPRQPYGYYAESIRFKNEKAGITLSGTLTLPSNVGSFPVVILISGSGPQNRDEEILEHKPFLVIADNLTKNGIGVLRFDDRGVGESQGIFATATTMDFVSDVEAAMDYLKGRKDVNKDKIGLAGHSEGGIIAPLVASNRCDVSFIVLLAGMGVKGSEIILAQQELIAKANGIPDEAIAEYRELNEDIFKMIAKEEKNPDLKGIITRMIISASKGAASDDFAMQQAEQFTSPWMLFFLNYSPAIALREVKCPILAINGSKDLQVPSKMNLKAIEECFNIPNYDSNKLVAKTNKDVTTIEIEGLNHMFQECNTGLPTEYSKIEQTFSPKALDIITEWILKRIK